ncbi:alpha-amylase family glycosyl hydrolase [Rubrobacter aplysinae]|uniref:alpha-amylase family glycosyl hydrolase n=1 Tax=Rubrobacter aplysinae TaxID=909625 RepID=UPI00064BAFD5
MDANGDGVGDLPGVVSKLDYLRWLRVDAVWLSPFYPSPMADFGYDIADHCGVDPLFGELADFDELLEGAHRREIRVILDYVPNHTSDEHPWFVEARSSRQSPKRAWYIWADPAPGGGPPNNWESIFGGGSWTWDEATRQYYMHTFDTRQPDLNWRNPEVREAMYGVLRFWLDRGVDGFRIDALSSLFKDEGLRDNPPNPDWRAGDPASQRQHRVYTDDQTEVLDVVRRMRSIADEYEGDRVLIGELYLPLGRLMRYYGTELDGLHLPFNFGLVQIPEWSAGALESLVEEYEAALPEGASPNWVLGNHDNPRLATRLGQAGTRVAQMLLLTLRGSPTCYYGDEIGMMDAEIPPEMTRDPQGIHTPEYNRDPARTPMRWDDSPNAGFCPPDVEPWLPLPESDSANVRAQSQDPRSTLSLVRRLIHLRHQTPALEAGSYHPLNVGADGIFAYVRECGGQRVLAIFNLGPEAATLDLSRSGPSGEVLCSTHLDRDGEVGLNSLGVRPDEGLLVSLSGISA